MATINTAHHESGGVVLFQGELILLFCENVNLNIVEKRENETGKLYLTTHRMIFTNSSFKNNLKSFSIPFYTMHDLSLEQPIFGANYIKGNATEPGNAGKLTFKLKFSSGGATEYGQALLNAAKSVRQMAQSSGFQPPPAYTNPASQYYQAPPNVYQPAYNCGFALPNDIFNQPPPAGFIYTQEAPPPYPGLNTNKSGPPPGQYNNNPNSAKQPAFAPQSGYPAQPGYNPAGPPQGQPGFAPQSGYPSQPGFTPQSGYPSQPGFAPQSGYPSQPGAAPQSGYPSQPGFAPQSGYPSQPGFAPQSGYPSQQQNGYPGGQPPAKTNESNQQSGLYPSLDLPAPSAPPM